MRMLSLVLNVELMAGVSPVQSVSDMVELANRIGCKVTSRFNGITMWCYPDDDVELIMKNYKKANKANEGNMIVSSKHCFSSLVVVQ